MEARTATAIMMGLAALLLASGVATADIFGTGGNQFTIDFVTVTGDASSANGTGIGPGKTFTDPGHDFRLGVYEITNDQWNKFTASLRVPVTGNPPDAYDQPSLWPDAGLPANQISWYEAAQFVNWLNTSTGHHAAYNFTGTQGTADYALAAWNVEQTDGTNLYRHSDAFYFLPTEDEWVKAGYWNGTSLQAFATAPGEVVHQGDGTSGTGWNYYDNGQYALTPPGPWEVGSGSQELNGTYDVMGNVWEWMESPYDDSNYGLTDNRAMRGGACIGFDNALASYNRIGYAPGNEYQTVGFRVAAEVPEPATMTLLALGLTALAVRRNRRS